MKNANVLIVLTIILLSIALPVSADVILNCDFEASTLGDPVGTGGPSVGEPTYTYTTTITAIRDLPMATRCLEITDNHTSGATIVFGFLMDTQVTTGEVDISMDLWFGELDSYTIYVREFDGGTSLFNTIRFYDNGVYSFADPNGNAATGSYSIDQLYTLQVIHDLDNGTYDVIFGGELIVDDRVHGIIGSGIGRLLVGYGADANLDGLFYIDNIVVSAPDVTPTVSTSWGSLKGLFR